MRMGKCTGEGLGVKVLWDTSQLLTLKLTKGFEGGKQSS
jgi:hypothetical protein